MLAGQDFLMDGGLTYKIKNNEVLFFKDKKRLGEISFFSSSPKVGDQVKGGPKEEKMILKIMVKEHHWHQFIILCYQK